MKNALITALALSTISLICGIISSFGVVGVGGVVGGTWITLSGVLTVGLTLLLAQYRTQNPSHPEILQITPDHFSEFDRTFPTENVQPGDDQSFSDWLAPLSASQIRRLVEEGVVDTKHYNSFSPLQVRDLFDQLSSCTWLLNEKNIRALRPDQLHLIDQSELAKCLKFFTPVQIKKFDLSQVFDSDLANGFLALSDLEISSDQLNKWLEQGLDLNPDRLSKEQIEGLFRSGNPQVTKEFLSERILGLLDSEQIDFLLDVFDFSKESNSDLANSFLARPDLEISSDQINKWLEQELSIDPDLLSDVQIRGLFRTHKPQVTREFLTRKICALLDSDQIDYLLDSTELSLLDIPPALITRELSIDQVNRVFHNFNQGNAKRVPQLDQRLLNQLILSGWKEDVLNFLSPEQVEALPFDKVSSEQLDQIFPIYGTRLLPDLRKKMAAISIDNIQYMLYTRELCGSWFVLLSEAQTRSLDFELLTDSQIRALFPVYIDSLLALAMERYQRLSSEQQKHLDPELIKKLSQD